MPRFPNYPTAGIFTMYHHAPRYASASSGIFVVDATLGPSSDGDQLPDRCDNCPEVANEDQADTDQDGIGDVCDACPNSAANDLDRDGVCFDVDECPGDPDNDQDDDGICGDEDNCPTVANPNQLDSDFNEIGDRCQTGPTCNDGVDNDNDGLIDFPEDPGCVSATSSSERVDADGDSPCDDGVDNDVDGRRDFLVSGGGDPGCKDARWHTESPECDDGEDNDGDGGTDWHGGRTADADSACIDRPWHDDEADAEREGTRPQS